MLHGILRYSLPISNDSRIKRMNWIPQFSMDVFQILGEGVYDDDWESTHRRQLYNKQRLADD